MRERFAWEVRSIKSAYSGILWAMERQLRQTNKSVSLQIRALRQEVGREFGLVSRIMAALLGPVMLWTSRREQRQLAEGKTYEPKTFIERRNWTKQPDGAIQEGFDQQSDVLPVLPQVRRRERAKATPVGV